jgi:predicted DNA binding CopG/RHH family protein
MNREPKPIDRLDDIPAGLSDEDRMAFLEEHGVSEYFLENAEEAPEEERPRPRTKPINIRFDDYTLTRLNELAARRSIGYQTLLKQFVTERLYEEEKREGLLAAGQAAEVEPDQEPPEDAGKRETEKLRDWQSWVYDFVKENEELLADPDIDSITLARLSKNASTSLLELSQEIKKVSAKEGYPAARLRRMRKGYDRLLKFTEAALALHEEKFGVPEEHAEGDEAEDAYSVVREAERIINESR